MTAVLLVEDDQEFAETCVAELLRGGFEVEYATDAEAARELLLRHEFGVVVIDLMLPPSYDAEGLELLRLVRSDYPKADVILISSKEARTTEPVANAMRLGAKNFLDKNVPSVSKRLVLEIERIGMERSDHVFVSHGHNELLRLKLAAYLQRRWGKPPVILSEFPSEGRTVVEKLEAASATCWFAVVLMTKDDEQKHGQKRPRQNVVHEIGFFQGKYGRRNVILLAEEGLELFTNISGIVRIDFEPGHFEASFNELGMEIEAARTRRRLRRTDDA